MEVNNLRQVLQLGQRCTTENMPLTNLNWSLVRNQYQGAKQSLSITSQIAMLSTCQITHRSGLLLWLDSLTRPANCLNGFNACFSSFVIYIFSEHFNENRSKRFHPASIIIAVKPNSLKLSNLGGLKFPASVTARAQIHYRKRSPNHFVPA